MPVTDPPPDPDPSTPADNGVPASPPPKRGPGRPGVPRTAVVDAIDTWIARTARPPSLRELRGALGDTGSLSTLGPILRAHAAERLLAGDAPARDSPDARVTQALNAAMAVLAGEASEAAEAAVALGAREADTRVAAAEARRRRAEAAGAESDLAHERALGRIGALEERLDERRREAEATGRDFARALEREAALGRTVAELEGGIGAQQAALERLEGERDGWRTRVIELEGALERERTARAAIDTAAARLEAERDGARASAATAEDARREALDAAARGVADAERTAHKVLAERAATRERCAALEQACTDAEAARARAEAALGAQRQGEGPNIARLLALLDAAEARLEREEDDAARVEREERAASDPPPDTDGEDVTA